MKNSLNNDIIFAERLSLLVALLLFLMVALFKLSSFEQLYHRPQHDLRAYLACGHNIVEGRHIYKTHHKFISADPTLTSHIPKYIYPPLLGMMAVPFNSVPYTTFKKYWFFFNFFMLFHGILLAVTFLPFKQYKLTAFFAVSAVMLGSDSLRLLLYTAQVDGLSIYLSMLALFYFNRKKWLPAAIFITVASWIKVTPGIFFLYFLTRGNLKFAVYGVISTLFLTIIQMAAVGRDQFFYFFTDVLTDLPEILPVPGMESLWSLTHLLVVPEGNYKIFDAPDLFNGLLTVFKIIVGLMLFLPFVRRSDRKDDFFTGFAILSAGSLLITDLSWMMRFIWNYVSLAVLFYIMSVLRHKVIAPLVIVTGVLFMLLNSNFIWWALLKGNTDGYKGLFAAGVSFYTLFSLIIMSVYYFTGGYWNPDLKRLLIKTIDTLKKVIP